MRILIWHCNGRIGAIWHLATLPNAFIVSIFNFIIIILRTQNTYQLVRWIRSISGNIILLFWKLFFRYQRLLWWYYWKMVKAFIVGPALLEEVGHCTGWVWFGGLCFTSAPFLSLTSCLPWGETLGCVTCSHLTWFSALSYTSPESTELSHHGQNLSNCQSNCSPKLFRCFVTKMRIWLTHIG